MTPATPLRILQVNSRFTGGGIDNQTLELAAGLKAIGDEVLLAVARGTRWESRARQTGAEVVLFEPHSPLQLGFIRCMTGLIRRRHIQILHAHQGSDYWPAILAARLAGRGTRVVITRHLMTRPRAMTRGLLLRFADIIAVSGAVEIVLRQELLGPARRIHQIYCGIDVARFNPERTPAVLEYRRTQGWGEDSVVFAVVGGYPLPRGKGQLEFVEAAAKAAQRCPQARFAIVGEGSMQSLLQERVAERNLNGILRMLPFDEDIPTVMSAIDVHVHPAVDTEAFALVNVEALASGRPVIGSRLHGIPEGFVENEHGLVVPPGDIEALASAMVVLAGDPERRARMGAAGNRHVRTRFGREVLARNTRELYLSLCAR